MELARLHAPTNPAPAHLKADEATLPVVHLSHLIAPYPLSPLDLLPQLLGAVKPTSVPDSA
eukprot:1037723-Rhodomonas_salina.3